MNRLVLIGNGFDLAHGLKTSYNDFLVWYVKKAFNEAFDIGSYDDDLLRIDKLYNSESFQMGDLKNVDSLVDHFYQIGLETLLYYDQFKINNSLNNYQNPFRVEVKSAFVKKLLTDCTIVNWVDIENYFYNELKAILKLQEDKKAQTLGKVNQSLACIIGKLEKYLEQLPIPLKQPAFDDLFTGPVYDRDVYGITINEEEEPKDIMVLNFNYTNTFKFYYTQYVNGKQGQLKVNFIHGRINDTSNKMVFGFGDELDDDYLQMEKEKVKGYFEFIKSFWYLKTSHYRDLLTFIEGEPFQVHVVGHSCGLSDRTMLHMIFEHPNCKSIKIFYHEIDRDTNNFTSLTHEIARHFKDKAMMRNKIVPFDRSQSMPQAY